MAKEALIEIDGTVLELLPDARFRIRLDNEHEILVLCLGKGAQGAHSHAGERPGHLGTDAVRPYEGAYQLSAQRRTRHAVHGCGPAIQPSTVTEETGFASLRRGRR